MAFIMNILNISLSPKNDIILRESKPKYGSVHTLFILVIDSCPQTFLTFPGEFGDKGEQR